jgi:hypothetical protein
MVVFVRDDPVVHGVDDFKNCVPSATFPLVRDFPDAAWAFVFNAAVFVGHSVARPLGGLVPADGFGVGLVGLVVLGLEDGFRCIG